MSINSKKLVSAALTATTLLWMVGATALPVASAQSTSDLQAQIAALLAQIQQLQTQLNANGGTSTSMTYDFTSDLTVGSTGAQVSSLQQLLISEGYLTAVSAPTGYFGALTQAALAAFQAAHGITPSVGYFGPKTRAFVNAMSTTTTPPPGNTGGNNPPPAASGLTVSLASNNPTAGSLITSLSGAGAARVPVMAVNFSAGNSGAVTVTEVKFHKTGVLADSSVAGAYLTLNGQVIAQYSSINQGVIDFSGLNWQIPAGQTEDVQLAIDVAGGLSAGNTTGFSLMSSSDVTAWDTNNNALTPMGNFPLNGNVFTVTSVTNPSLATVSIASSSIGTQVTAGSQGNLVGGWNFTVQNSKVWLEGLTFHVIGSANKSNLTNIKLMVNGTQVGATLASVAQDGTAYFNASVNPGVLNTGSNNVQVFADVTGSPSYNFQFEILNSYDVLAVDSQYNVPVTITNTGGTGTQVTIQQGQITVTQDASTPTGNVAKGQSQVTLAKFDFYAAGEAVRVKFLDFSLTFTGQSGVTSLANQIRNVSLVDDAGGQLGSTINQPPTGNSCSGSTNSYATSSATSVYSDCFGTSASQINYVIPANTTRVLSLKADIQSTASFSTVTGALLAESTPNLQGLTSSQTAISGGATGSALTLSNSSLAVSKNSALGNQNVSAGVTNQRIGSYAFTASSAEGVNVSNVSIQANGQYFQNLQVFVNGSQFGTTQGTVSSGTVYTFSGTPFNVPAGSTVNLDVFASTLSSATSSVNPATALTGVSASGQISFTAIGLTGGTVNGQNLTFAGAPSITVGADSSNPPAGQVVQGSAGNTLAVFAFRETSNVESVKVTQLNVVDAVTATATVLAAFNPVTLWNGSTLLGTSASPVPDASGTGYLYVFNNLTNFVVPQGNSVSVALKGTAGTFINGSMTDNTAHTFEIATTTDSSNNTTALAVTALGNTSNRSAAVTLSNASGNAQTVLRSVLTATGASVGSLPPASIQPIGTITLTANSAGDVQMSSLKLTTNNVSSTFLNTLVLKDSGSNDIVAVKGYATTTVNAGAGTVTWTFATSTVPLVIGAGNSYTLTLYADLSKIPSISSQSQSLTVTIANNGDLSYYDYESANGGLLVTLPVNATPITISNLTTPVGGQF